MGIGLARWSYTFHDDDPTDRLDKLILIDEALTPDSSRFWDARRTSRADRQASFDKQFVRDWLEAQPWDKTAPGPALPDDVVAGTRARYIEAYERITGASFERYLAGGRDRAMTSFRFAVNVTPKDGILDPAGRAVEGSLGHLGIEGVTEVRIGRRVELMVEAADESRGAGRRRPAGIRAPVKSADRVVRHRATGGDVFDASAGAGEA